MEIELGSHTDARGREFYNDWLSKKRAETAVAYILSQGIEAERVKAIGYGEHQPLNECKDNVPCTEQQHQINRRTEVTITKLGTPNVEVYWKQ